MIRNMIIGLFVTLVCLNLYFRYKLMPIFKVLHKNKVPMNATYIFNTSRMEKELIPHYPKFEKEIRLLASRIRRSIVLALSIVLTITALGITLYLNG